MSELIDKMLGFLKSIGIAYHLEPLPDDTFLPGLDIRDGALIVDTAKLLYPGDILHEAGHLACVPPELRVSLLGAVERSGLMDAVEMMAMAWSYAAALYLEIDPHVVFHEHGYRGSGANLVAGYQSGGTMGVPMLQFAGMSMQPHEATDELPAFPHMLHWTPRRWFE